MEKNRQRLALMLSGTLLSVVAKIVLDSNNTFSIKWLLALIVITVALILYGFNYIQDGYHKVNLWWRENKRSRKIGIMSDLEQYTNTIQDQATFSSSNVCSEEWKRKLASQIRKDKLTIKQIKTDCNFDSYDAILNPSGSVYPERDLSTFSIQKKIFNYVNEGGIFINVADIPGYFAYNTALKRKLDATRPIYGIGQDTHGGMAIVPIRPFELTPFVEKLGIRILNVESEPDFSEWLPEFERDFSELRDRVKNPITINRVAVLERNVRAIIKAKKRGSEEITPLFSVDYGEGEFLFSLLFFGHQYPQNDYMNNVMADIILKTIR